MLEKSGFAAEQEIEFEILDVGDASGYNEESYLVIKSETDWVSVWLKQLLFIFPRSNLQKWILLKTLLFVLLWGRDHHRLFNKY